MIQYIFWVVSFITVWLSLVWIEFLLNPPVKNKKLERLPKITIAIPAYNEEKGIAKTLDSLLKLNYPKKKLQILVVNDGSKDKTAKVARKYADKHDHITLLNKKNGGKTSAVNLAIDHANGELFAVLDADSRVDSDSLKKILLPLQKKKTGAAISRIRVDPGTFVQGVQRFEYIMSNFLRKIMSNVNTLCMTPGVLSVYKLKLLRKLGGFTRDKKNLTEDLEIALRIKNAGYDVVMADDAVTHTTAPKNLRILWTQRIRWYRGYIYNMINYKHLFFTRKHGLFSMFQMPVNLLAVILLVTNVSIISWQLGSDGLEFLLRSLTIPHYFINTILNFPTLQEFFLARNLQITIPVLIVLVLGVWMIVKAHRMFNERLRTNILNGVAYTVLGPYFTTMNWLSSIMQETLNSKRKW